MKCPGCQTEIIKLDHHAIVEKLIGPITAVGETHADEKRLVNLKATCELVERLVEDIRMAARAAGNDQFSMKQIGRYAEVWLEELKDL